MSEDFWIERKTMTKWRKVGETFTPIGKWTIARDPSDVLEKGLFQGPYNNGEDK